jgi:hypothetical protein
MRPRWTAGRPGARLAGLGWGVAAAALALGNPAGTALAAPAAQAAGCPPYDVVPDVPSLAVDELTLEVERLRAQLNPDARVAALATVAAGVGLSTATIALTLRGVAAEAHLSVCLDDVRAIVERTLATLDRHPQLLTGLLGALAGLLSQTVNPLGQPVARVVDGTGQILERTLDGSGNVLAQQVVGHVAQLPVASQTTNAAGQTVRRVVDPSGAVIAVVVDAAGRVSSEILVGGQAILGRLRAPSLVQVEANE